MSNIVRSRIIILKTTKYSEADLIVHGLSQKGAQTSWLARSALKSRRRFGGGVLEPSHFIEGLIREPSSGGSSNRKMATLEEATLLDAFDALRSSYEKLHTAMFILSVVKRSSQEGEVHGGDLFDLTGNSLKALETEDNTERLRIHFMIRFMRLQGVLDSLAWMTPFLNFPMSQGSQIEWEGLSAMDKIKIEHALESYLKTAEA